MIIGISGKARSGKDTFAKMLATELNVKAEESYILMAYAEELKVRCQQDFDLSYDQLWGDDKEVPDKRYPKPDGDGYWTGREIMQAYGQFMRTIDNDFWVKNLFRVIEDKGYTNVIITDLRHINEADAVADREGFNIRVERTNRTEVHGTEHPSEVALDDYGKFDFTVVNDSSLDQLRLTAKETVGLIYTIPKKNFKEIING